MPFRPLTSAGLALLVLTALVACDDNAGLPKPLAISVAATGTVCPQGIRVTLPSNVTRVDGSPDQGSFSFTTQPPATVQRVVYVLPNQPTEIQAYCLTGTATGESKISFYAKDYANVNNRIPVSVSETTQNPPYTVTPPGVLIQVSKAQ